MYNENEKKARNFENIIYEYKKERDDLKTELKNLKEFYATDKVGNECLIEALEKRVAELTEEKDCIEESVMTSTFREENKRLTIKNKELTTENENLKKIISAYEIGEVDGLLDNQKLTNEIEEWIDKNIELRAEIKDLKARLEKAVELLAEATQDTSYEEYFTSTECHLNLTDEKALKERE